MNKDLTSFYPSKQLKYCPFCGSSAFAAVQGKFMHRCPDCLRSLYTNAAGAVIALIRNPQKEILFTRRKYNPSAGMLDLPGGFVSPGEKAEEAVVREVKEELNLIVVRPRFLASLPNEYLFDGIVYYTMDLIFACEVADLSVLAASDDVSDAVWLPLRSVKVGEIGLHSVRKLIESMQQHDDGDFSYL